MAPVILATKLYAPPPRPHSVPRPRLVERLNAGLHRRLTLISAPAGFGKTTLVSAWLATCGRPAAWLSLDETDSDPTQFLTYLAAALQPVASARNDGVLGLNPSLQSLPAESVLTALLNAASASARKFILVLDDYHLVDSPAVDQALAFLVEHLPPQLHLVIGTREDPNLPLARLRAGDQLTELRAADLRFTPAEAAAFLNQVMNLHLAAEEVAALEAKTEGWIAGLQLAALSLQGRGDRAGFVNSFAGSHHFVLDYLMEEVLLLQPSGIQTFLLHTSILDRMCGSLCDAVLHGDGDTRTAPPMDGQETLRYLERANLFVVPLDNERRWYRYHHLFADLLRHRLQQAAHQGTPTAEYHIRASLWFEEHGLEIEAFQHAAAANDIPRAVRLVEGKGMSLLFRGAVAPVLHWLASLPATLLDSWPSLWVMYASALLYVGQLAEVEEKLLSAQGALLRSEPNATHEAGADAAVRDLQGHIASIRATLAVSRSDAEVILAEARRALELLHPDNLPVRTAVTWMLGVAWQLLGKRAAAGQAFAQAAAASEEIGHFIIAISAATGLGNIQEGSNQLHAAAQSYRRALQVAGETPPPVACETHLGLARIFYEWDDLAAAEQHVGMALELAEQMPGTDRFVVCQLFLARLRLAQGDATAATALLAQASQAAQAQQFMLRLPEIAAAQVLTLIHQGNLASAAHLAATHRLPASQARVYLAQGDAPAALAVLDPLRRQMESAGWEDERLKVVVLQALALHAGGREKDALQLLAGALATGEPEGFRRLFVGEGPAIAPLLSAAAAQGILPDYAGKLLEAIEPVAQKRGEETSVSSQHSLAEPLTQRELEVLRLVAQGLSNQEIGERLFLALDTVKGHNRRIFEKLQVQRRTEAVAKARALRLLLPDL